MIARPRSRSPVVAMQVGFYGTMLVGRHRRRKRAYNEGVGWGDFGGHLVGHLGWTAARGVCPDHDMTRPCGGTKEVVSAQERPEFETNQGWHGTCSEFRRE